MSRSDAEVISMRCVRSLLYCVVAALAVLGWASSANAQAQRVGICVESVNPTTGANQCNDGWTPLILNGLKTTAISIKATPGALGKIYCLNPNGTAAYLQIYNATATAAETALLAGTQAPTNSYGFEGSIAQSVTFTPPGDWYGTAISAAVATTATGNTQPTTGMDCNVSFN